MVGSNQDSAEAIDPADTDTVYIADGTNFADALMGATVASLNTSPMLGVAGTNSGDIIPDDTVEELDRLTNDRSDLLDTIYIFGGDQAVSDSVAGQLGDWANNVQRIEGDSRWGTYQAISEMLPSAIDEAVHAREADNADTLDGRQASTFAQSGHRHLALFDSATKAGDLLTGTSVSAISGMTATVTIPDGHTGVIVARYNALSTCQTSGSKGLCRVMIAADGQTMNPTPPDPNNGCDHSVGESEAEARSIQRISDELGPGTYTVQVEVEMENSDVELRVFEQVLTAEVKLTS